MMRSIQKGFTLIELVVVIVILGILAAVAIPRFVDLSTEAKAAALQGVQGSLSSAMAVNYGACAAVGFVAGAKCVAVNNCDDAAAVLTGGLPTGYTVAAGAIGAGNGSSANCPVAQTDGGATLNFVAIRTAAD